MSTAMILGLGVLLGLRHALDADHLAAMATLATRAHSGRDALRQGVAWGLGHTTTLLLVGGAVLAAGTTIPAGLATLLEGLVGVMLLALGLDLLRRLRAQGLHWHVHEHAGGVRHVHLHAHALTRRGFPGLAPALTSGQREPLALRDFVPAGPEPAHRLCAHDDHAHAPDFSRRALVVGMVHGTAGSAALVLLSLEALDSVWLGIVHILLFGAGSLLGMAAMTLLIAWPLQATGALPQRVQAGLLAACGMFSCAVGGWLMIGLWPALRG